MPVTPEIPWISAGRVTPAAVVDPLARHSAGATETPKAASVWLADSTEVIQLAVGVWGLQVYQGAA